MSVSKADLLDLVAEVSCLKLAVLTFKSLDLCEWLAVNCVKSVLELLTMRVERAVRLIG